MKLLNDAPTDAVTELLAALRVDSSVYCLSDLGAPWGFVVDGADTAKFHLVLEGACWLQAEGLDPVRLGAGELAILPRGERHAMSDELDSPVTGLDQLIADHPLDAEARLRSGGDGAHTRLLCGGFALSDRMPAPLELLPPIVTMDPGSATVSAWIEPVFALVRQEASRAAPGAQVIFAKLADVFLAQALRAYLDGAGRTGLLRPGHGTTPRSRRPPRSSVISPPGHGRCRRWPARSACRARCSPPGSAPSPARAPCGTWPRSGSPRRPATSERPT
jgi:hypothetical protein